MTDGDAVRCSWLQAGATVCIGAASDAACGSTHTVKAGDSCWAIWSSKGLTEAAFYDLNPGIDCDTLQVRVKGDFRNTAYRYIAVGTGWKIIIFVVQ